MRASHGSKAWSCEYVGWVLFFLSYCFPTIFVYSCFETLKLSGYAVAQYSEYTVFVGNSQDFMLKKCQH